MTAFNSLIEWSQKEYSDLPWRKNITLYRVLVSEIMLQQTTVPVVLKYFDSFIEKFPDIFSLASASEEEVCMSWKGLGYYKRAKNLRNIALQVVERYNGKIPIDPQILQSLKGIGPYTAHALYAFGLNKTTLAIDANVERVLARYYGKLTSKGPLLQRELKLDFEAGRILTEMRELGSANLHGALMDLGRTFCRAKSADCQNCPLQLDCQGKNQGALTFNTKKPVSDRVELRLLRMVVEKNGMLLFYKKKSDEWVADQWELPTYVLPGINLNNFTQYPSIASGLMRNAFTLLPSVKTSITKYKIVNYIFQVTESDFFGLKFLDPKFISRYQYIPKDQLQDFHLSSATEKILSLTKSNF